MFSDEEVMSNYQRKRREEGHWKTDPKPPTQPIFAERTMYQSIQYSQVSYKKVDLPDHIHQPIYYSPCQYRYK